jgi:hypothetical protein
VQLQAPRDLTAPLILCKYDFNDRIEDEIGKACSRYGEKMNAYMVLVAKPEGKRPLGRARCRWEDNIKMDLR